MKISIWCNLPEQELALGCFYIIYYLKVYIISSRYARDMQEFYKPAAQNDFILLQYAITTKQIFTILRSLVNF